MSGRPIKVYLAASWRRQARMRDWRAHLEAWAGAEVTARWIDMPEAAMTDEAAQQAAAEVCLADVEAADILVCLAETPDEGYLTGGRHVEVGYALALGRPVHLVGAAENVFHFHGRVQRWPDLGPLLQHLSAHRVQEPAS